MKKRIYIVFAGRHLAYSPTTLNLRNELSKKHDVKIVTFNDTGHYYKLDKNYIIYLDLIKFNWLLYILSKLPGSFINNYDSITFLRRVTILNFFLFRKFDKIIAVDFRALNYVSRLCKGKVDFLSLELKFQRDELQKLFHTNRVDSLIIQNKTREKVLNLDGYKNSFYIQNSSSYFKEIEQSSIKREYSKRLVFSGTSDSRFGIYSCINFLKSYENFTLDVMGNIPTFLFESLYALSVDLIHEGRIKLINEYLEEKDHCIELSKRDVGLCFYDFHHPKVKKHFDNYYYAPSGKMFKYLASGVPIVGSDIPGLKLVEEYNAGILIKDLTPKAIFDAINKIEYNYTCFVENCFLAIREYDFNKLCTDYINYLSHEKC